MTQIDTTNTEHMISVIRHAMEAAAKIGCDRAAWLRRGRKNACRYERKPGGFAHAQQQARISAYDALLAEIER